MYELVVFVTFVVDVEVKEPKEGMYTELLFNCSIAEEYLLVIAVVAIVAIVVLTVNKEDVRVEITILVDENGHVEYDAPFEIMSLHL